MPPTSSQHLGRLAVAVSVLDVCTLEFEGETLYRDYMFPANMIELIVSNKSHGGRNGEHITTMFI